MSNGNQELERLLGQNEVTGLASATVSADRLSVDVRFYISPDELVPIWEEPPQVEQVRIFSPVRDLDLAVTERVWANADGVTVLHLSLGEAIGFSLYRLQIDHPRIAPAFSELTFRATIDRLQRLLQQHRAIITGIDFVHVHDDQQTLDVYFHVDPASLNPTWTEVPSPERVLIVQVPGGSGLAQVPVSTTTWAGPDEVTHGRQVLRVTTELPGGFSPYRLFIDESDDSGNSRIDPYFNGVTFSFKAVCESDLDCKERPQECPPEDEVDFPVDYQARDFWSLRQALLDFASQRYPDWQDRLEADAGIMLAEVMSALGDELAYYQDRIGREAYLETATQRRSLRRHARLVDYEIHDGLAASTWLDVTVTDGGSVNLLAGTGGWAESDDGGRIDYEVGNGLAKVTTYPIKTYPVGSQFNSLWPHIWDEDDTCLPVGATELFVTGAFSGLLRDDADSGRWMLLKTEPDSAGIPARRWLVRVIQVEGLTDPLLGEEITRLVWDKAQALPFELDLTVLEVRGNLVPATAGRTQKSYFLIGRDPDDPALYVPPAVRPTLIRAVERQGRRVEGRALEDCTVYLCSLPGSDETPLCWLGERPEEAMPEVRLRTVEDWEGEEPQLDEANPWEWCRSFLGTNASQGNDPHFTLDDGVWKRVVGYQRIGREIMHRDYASGEGKTVRFGDGEFGMVPTQGTIFQVTYRLGNGRRGNVAADSLTGFDRGSLGFIEAITNPFAVENGVDPETPQQVRQLAPDAFRAVTYRAVRPEDYAEAAERLPWVQRASGAFRWTGSWITAFVTPDPLDATALTEEQHRELSEQIDRFRQAGREVYVAEPRYADLDLEITVCVEPFAYRGEVKERVLEALVGRIGQPGFFSPDNFTFGTPLRRSQLEATVQRVTGVKAVEGIRYRRRGVFDWRDLAGPHYPVGDFEVIRVDNDPNHPGHGSLKLEMRGGA